ncbi:MAG TPA: hypothetical protein VH969_11125 [Actinophytocola sp.]|jgi:hypothetical protein|uniref:hypothetical protein n=1 Tax=Actinophytocola sp. TaxID=1872138 RepID=UPI002F94CF38
MAARAERPEDVEQAPEGQAKRRSPAEVRAAVVGFLAGLVRWAGLLFAIILAVHVVLVVGNANPANGITRFFADAAEPLALAFRSLFTPENAELRVLINYGLAALFWLVASAVLARLIRRLG